MNTQRTISIFLIAALLSACSNKENEAAPPPAGMHALNLSRYGKPFEIFVPDTTRSQLQITEQSSGALEIKVGRSFAISVMEGAADLDLKKSDLKADDVNKLKNISKDEPDGMIWESAITEPEFHFLRNSRAGSAEYSFEDIRAEDGRGYGKEAIEMMYNSCRDIRAISPQEPS